MLGWLCGVVGYCGNGEVVHVQYKKTHVLSEDKCITLLILNFDAIWR